jgi:hypothetical protein
MPIDQYHYDKNRPRKLRQKKKETHFKMSPAGVKDFQTTFPGITNLRGIYTKLKHLKSINHLWYSSRVSSGKLIATEKDAVALGTGATNLENIEVSGFNEGKKTLRMTARTTKKKPKSL